MVKHTLRTFAIILELLILKAGEMPTCKAGSRVSSLALTAHCAPCCYGFMPLARAAFRAYTRAGTTIIEAT
eukprot:s7027_g4.t1